MPAALQASISSVPAGAVNCFPSTVKFTSAIVNARQIFWIPSLLSEIIGFLSYRTAPQPP